MKHFAEWMEEGSSNIGGNIRQTKRLLFGDGSSLSIQAGFGNRCSHPNHESGFMALRENYPYKEYAHFELGFPNKEIIEIIEYAEDENDLLETVYNFVPKEVIEDLIEKRGGVVGYDE